MAWLLHRWRVMVHASTLGVLVATLLSAHAHASPRSGSTSVAFQLARPRLAHPAALLNPVSFALPAHTPVPPIQLVRPELAVRLLTFLGGAGAAFSAATAKAAVYENPVTGRVQRVRLSPDEEIALGRSFAPAMIGNSGGIHPDERLQLHVRAIGSRVVVMNGLFAPYSLQFTVLASKQPRMFCLPGGLVFVSEGALHHLFTDAGFAVALSHEMVHAVGRHASENVLQRDYANGVLAAAALAVHGLPNPGAELAEVGRHIELGILSHSRDQETESDLVGMRLAHRAGFDARAGANDLIDFLSRMEAHVPEHLSDHPSATRRAEQLWSEILRAGYGGGEVGRESYQQHVRDRLPR